jgi:hypothetical protein
MLIYARQTAGLDSEQELAGALQHENVITPVHGSIWFHLKIEVPVQRPGVASVTRHELKIRHVSGVPPLPSQSVCGLRFAVCGLRLGALPCPLAQHETKIV